MTAHEQELGFSTAGGSLWDPAAIGAASCFHRTKCLHQRHSQPFKDLFNLSLYSEVLLLCSASSLASDFSLKESP